MMGSQLWISFLAVLPKKQGLKVSRIQRINGDTFEKLSCILIMIVSLLIICPMVGAAAPVAQFTGDPVAGASPLTVTFHDTSTGNPTGWAWFFGDETYDAPWTQQTGSAVWSARDGHSSVALPDGSIVLMGGYDGDDKNDVWRSTDKGVTWTQQTGSAGWSARVSHSTSWRTDMRRSPTHRSSCGFR